MFEYQNTLQTLFMSANMLEALEKSNVPPRLSQLVHARSNQCLIYVYLISSSKDSLAFDIYVQRLLCFNAQMGGCFHHTDSLYPKIQRTKEHSVFCMELKRPHSLNITPFDGM